MEPAASACATFRIAAFLHFDTKETSWAGLQTATLVQVVVVFAYCARLQTLTLRTVVGTLQAHSRFLQIDTSSLIQSPGTFQLLAAGIRSQVVQHLALGAFRSAVACSTGWIAKNALTAKRPTVTFCVVSFLARANTFPSMRKVFVVAALQTDNWRDQPSCASST